MTPVELIRDEDKQLGLLSLAINKYDDAINYFNLWQYAYVEQYGIDKYKYDFDLLHSIETQLQSDFPLNTSDVKLKDGEKIRVVYLTHVLNTPSAIMAKILLDLIKYHDTSKFEIYVFTLENWLEIYMSPGRDFINQFKDANCHIHYATHFAYGFKKLLSIAKEINELKPHVMTTCVALADFRHFFIAALKPAPIRIGFVVGPPAQFIPLSFDYGMSWFTHSIADCPIPCLYTGIIYIPEEKLHKVLLRSNYGIPDDAVVITSTGRHPKFQDNRMLNLVVEIMKRLYNLHYIIIMSHPDKLDLDNVPVEVRKRIHVFGWSQSYEDYFSMSDIYLDTFPSGGGTTIQDAALAKLPIISFEDDLGIPFDQSNWNPAEDLLPSESMVLIRRYHIDQDLKVAIYDLYKNRDWRKEMGNKAYEAISSMRSNIGDNVKKIEKLYSKLVEEKL